MTLTERSTLLDPVRSPPHHPATPHSKHQPSHPPSHPRRCRRRQTPKRKQTSKSNRLLRGVFLLIDPELHARVASHLDNKLLDLNRPIVTPEEIELPVPDDIEAQLVLKEINVRKGAGSAFAAVRSFNDEVTAGYGEGEQGEHWAVEPSCAQEGDVVERCDR